VRVTPMFRNMPAITLRSASQHSSASQHKCHNARTEPIF
jgi:hypothetical protein